MKRKAAAAVVAVIAIIAVAGAYMLLSEDDAPSERCVISYELNGGQQNPSNPTEYVPGETVSLYDAFDDNAVFTSWYLDEHLTQPCDFITSDMSGDITLYAGWSDDMVGKGLEYSVQGTYTSGIMSSYDMEGTVSYEYLYLNDAESYLIGTHTDMVYSFMGMQSSSSDSDSYWSGGSDTQWTESGYQTIDTCNGTKECLVMVGTHSNGSTETQWIGDGWIPYVMEYSISGAFSSQRMIYVLTDVYNVETHPEVELTVYQDLGITVSGEGTYSPGDTAVLTAETEPGYTFSGWYDSGGSLLSTSESVTISLDYGEVEVYAMNTADPDVSILSGGTIDGVAFTDTTEWTVTDRTGEQVLRFTGDPSLFPIDGTGSYTVTTVDPDSGEHHVFTVLVDGTTTLSYAWSYGGNDYNMDLDILYSDVQYYRDYYDVSQRQQDILGGHIRDRTFVTYEDRYVVGLAETFTEMTAGMSQLEKADFVLAFTQSLGYQDDSIYMGYEEYWKFPLETLYDHGGDCEDTSILYSAIMEAMGYDTALLIFPGHMAPAVALDDCDGHYFYQYGSSKRYYYCETTSADYSVGEMPASMVEYRANMVIIS